MTTRVHFPYQMDGRGRTREDDEAAWIRGLIEQVLFTAPGERVMRPEYGCDIHELVFAPCDGTTAGLAIHLIRQALTRWEPRAKLIKVDADFDPDRPGCLMLSVLYEVRSIGVRNALAVAVDLTGEGPS